MHLLECRCGCFSASRMPREEVLRDFYKDYYSAIDGTATFDGSDRFASIYSGPWESRQRAVYEFSTLAEASTRYFPIAGPALCATRNAQRQSHSGGLQCVLSGAIGRRHRGVLPGPVEGCRHGNIRCCHRERDCGTRTVPAGKSADPAELVVRGRPRLLPNARHGVHYPRGCPIRCENRLHLSGSRSRHGPVLLGERAGPWASSPPLRSCDRGPPSWRRSFWPTLPGRSSRMLSSRLVKCLRKNYSMVGGWEAVFAKR